MQKEKDEDERYLRTKILTSQKLLAVDLYADWCGPCKIVSPIIERLAKEYEGTVEFLKIDVDKNASLANEFNILAIPTVMLAKKGRVLSKVIGVQSTSTYREKNRLCAKGELKMSNYPKGRTVALGVLGGLIGVLVMGAIAYMMPVPNTEGAPFFVAAAMMMGMGSMAYAAGWALHIITGLVIGVIFGAIVASVQRLNVRSIGKGVALGGIAGIVVWLIFFMPMMAALMPALMGMSTMLIGSFFAHLIFGSIMGSITFLAIRGSSQ
jgi:thioredoxin 1